MTYEHVTELVEVGKRQANELLATGQYALIGWTTVKNPRTDERTGSFYLASSVLYVLGRLSQNGGHRGQ